MQNIFSSYILGTLIFNIFFGLNRPVEEITSYIPNDNLMDPTFILSFFVHCTIGSIGIIIIYQILVI